VSFGVESYDSICDFAQGLIEADELAYDLGHNAAAVTGGTLAGAKVGAMAGTVVGPIGTVAGGIVGGLVGTVVASGVYETVIEHTPEAAGEIAESIEGYANSTMDMIANQVPDQFDNARSAFNDFFSSNNIPVRV
jgi:phage tail tape-measure protein